MNHQAYSPSPLSRFHRLSFRFGRRLVTRGFDVRAMLPGREEWRLIAEKVVAALDLIANRDPRRFAYLRRDLPRIWVTGLPASIGQCHYRVGLCALDFEYVISADTSVGHVAQTLIHEGTHARLERAGFGYGEAVRPRIERICVRQEAAFARLLPAGTNLVAEVEARLRNPDALFTNQARRQRELEALRDLGSLGRFAYRITTRFRRRAV